MIVKMVLYGLKYSGVVLISMLSEIFGDLYFSQIELTLMLGFGKRSNRMVLSTMKWYCVMLEI